MGTGKGWIFQKFGIIKPENMFFWYVYIIIYHLNSSTDSRFSLLETIKQFNKNELSNCIDLIKTTRGVQCTARNNHHQNFPADFRKDTLEMDRYYLGGHY